MPWYAYSVAGAFFKKKVEYGIVWYLPLLALTWLLGLAMMRGFTEPCERRMRRWLLPSANDSADRR